MPIKEASRVILPGRRFHQYLDSCAAPSEYSFSYRKLGQLDDAKNVETLLKTCQGALAFSKSLNTSSVGFFCETLYAMAVDLRAHPKKNTCAIILRPKKHAEV